MRGPPSLLLFIFSRLGPAWSIDQRARIGAPLQAVVGDPQGPVCYRHTNLEKSLYFALYGDELRFFEKNDIIPITEYHQPARTKE